LGDEVEDELVEVDELLDELVDEVLVLGGGEEDE